MAQDLVYLGLCVVVGDCACFLATLVFWVGGSKAGRVLTVYVSPHRGVKMVLLCFLG